MIFLIFFSLTFLFFEKNMLDVKNLH